jgi:hypothetical protein
MNFDDFSANWDAEKAFWADRDIETFSLEETGGYCSYRYMVKQNYTRDNGYWGDWVRSEDYRRDVEKLEARIKELEAEKKSLTLPSP